MIFQKNSQNNFLIIGRVGMDLTPTPQGVHTQDANNMAVSMGGSAANIAAGLVRLGCNSALVTVASDDAIGWYCENQLDAYGIDRSYVRRVQGEFRTSLAVSEATIDNHQTVIYRNHAADFQLSITDVEAIDYHKFSAMILTGTIFAVEPSCAAGFKAIELAKNAGVPVVFDIDYRPYSWESPDHACAILSQVCDLCDVVVGNDTEFSVIAAPPMNGLDKAKQLIKDRAKLVVYKQGEKGAITFFDTQELHTDIYTVKAIKPTGAGDSFLAGLLSSLYNDYSVEEAVKRGSACAAIVVTKIGCAPAMPTLDELEKFMDIMR